METCDSFMNDYSCQNDSDIEKDGVSGDEFLPIKHKSGMFLDTMKEEQERRKRDRKSEKSGERGGGGRE